MHSFNSLDMVSFSSLNVFAIVDLIFFHSKSNILASIEIVSINNLFTHTFPFFFLHVCYTFVVGNYTLNNKLCQL